MLSKISKGVGDRISYMQALSEELRGIAFHIENTDAAAYGNTGCEHGRYKVIDNGGVTRDRDVDTLKKVAKLFEDFWGKEQKTS